MSWQSKINLVANKNGISRKEARTLLYKDKNSRCRVERKRKREELRKNK